MVNLGVIVDNLEKLISDISSGLSNFVLLMGSFSAKSKTWLDLDAEAHLDIFLEFFGMNNGAYIYFRELFELY